MKVHVHSRNVSKVVGVPSCEGFLVEFLCRSGLGRNHWGGRGWGVRTPQKIGRTTPTFYVAAHCSAQIGYTIRILFCTVP